MRQTKASQSDMNSSNTANSVPKWCIVLHPSTINELECHLLASSVKSTGTVTSSKSMHPRQSFACLRPRGACNVAGEVNKLAMVFRRSLPDQLCSSFSSQSRAYQGNIRVWRVDHHCCKPIVGCMVYMQEDPGVGLFLATSEARDICGMQCTHRSGTIL